jgi:hypothetical protein
MRKALAVALIAASAPIATCKQTGAEPPGPTVSRRYEVSDFREIEVSGPYDAQVRTGTKPAVSGRGPQKLLDRTVVEVKGSKLIIRPERWPPINGKADFAVTVPRLVGATIAVKANGRAHVRLMVE